ncbi:MAG: transposase [Stellaceae bacterium]
MVDATPFLPGLSPVQGKAVVARFAGGRRSSEGGLLALREIERRLGLADRLAGCLKAPRMAEKVVHPPGRDHPVSRADDRRGL